MTFEEWATARPVGPIGSHGYRMIEAAWDESLDAFQKGDQITFDRWAESRPVGPVGSHGYRMIETAWQEVREVHAAQTPK